MASSKLNLTRGQFASFLKNHDQIKQFEKLFSTMDAISLQNAATNSVYAGPAAGIAAPPEFRALVLTDLPNGVALTKVDDLNVTLTLGGSPLIALLKATSITLGWTGTLGIIRGGTGLNALGAGVQAWIETPSSANLRAAVTDETGTGALVFNAAPSISDLTISGLSGNVYGNTWTPGLTNVSNISASSASTARYARINDIVIFAGMVTIDPTVAGSCNMLMTLPVSSNFTAGANASGTFATTTAGQTDQGSILANTVSDELELRFTAINIASANYSYTGNYRIN